MRHNLRHNNLAQIRVQIRCVDYTAVVFYLLLCAYMLYEIHVLSSLGDNIYLSASTYLLHFYSQPSSYYLLYMPTMIVLLSKIIDLGPYELVVYARSKTRLEYTISKLLATIYYVIGCSTILFLTSLVVFNCVSVSSENWFEQISWLEQQGIRMLREGLAHFPKNLIVFLQIVIQIQSFIALGYLMVFLQMLFRRKSLSIIVCFGVNCFLLLGTKSDLPKWLFAILPYQYQFYPFFNSSIYALYAIVYWSFVIAGLLLMIIYQTKRTDLFFSNYENLFT